MSTHRRVVLCIAVGAVALAGCASGPAAAAGAETTVVVSITGGHALDPRDAGRPVALVAGALGVPAAAFRTAFRGVTPAAGGEAPDPAQVTRNKAALLEVLAAYGVTNEALDAASDRYRYVPGSGARWPTRAARAVAVVRSGRVVRVHILDGGAGYTSPPLVRVSGRTGTAVLSFGAAVNRNGSIASIRFA